MAILLTPDESRFYPTKILGGVSMLAPIFLQRCKVCLCRLTYSDFGGWNWITQSSSSQKMDFT